MIVDGIASHSTMSTSDDTPPPPPKLVRGLVINPPRALDDNDKEWVIVDQSNTYTTQTEHSEQSKPTAPTEDSDFPRYCINLSHAEYSARWRRDHPNEEPVSARQTDGWDPNRIHRIRTVN